MCSVRRAIFEMLNRESGPKINNEDISNLLKLEMRSFFKIDNLKYAFLQCNRHKTYQKQTF